MTRPRSRRVAAALGSLALIAGTVLGTSSPASAEPVLDQSFTAGSDLDSTIGYCCVYEGQTFRDGLTGWLTGVNVDVMGNAPTFRLQVQIRSVDSSSGLPTSTVLGETTLDSDDAPMSRLITFPTSIPVTAGVEYAIVVGYPGAPVGTGINGDWFGSTRNRYPYGEHVEEGDGRWVVTSVQREFDVHFQTYVEPASGNASCGLTVTSDFQLDRDLGPCQGDGLIVDASDVTLDLRGHTITGEHAGRGIYVKQHDSGGVD